MPSLRQARGFAHDKALPRHCWWLVFHWNIWGILATMTRGLGVRLRAAGK